LGKVLTTPHHKNACYEILHRTSESDELFGTTWA